ncbi:MAG: L,D-transpeptidase family protein [Alphaproteobacteria bacterium]|nr:L,D-transpeptidase family protein [Alphaproteobacteria bacterium]
MAFKGSRVKRRDVLAGLGAGAFAAMTGRAFAEDPVIENMRRAAALARTDREGNTVAALEAIDTYEPILSLDTAYNLELAILQHEQIVKNGGWGEMARNAVGLVAGASSNVVIKLKRRLMASSDMEETERVGDLFDAEMDAGIRRFQARHGLHITGKIDPETYMMLNVPAETRLAQLRLNALRVQRFAQSLTERYILVNIPAAAIETVEVGQVFHRHTAVVGRIDRQTPILSSQVYEINFNPYWTVPKSIIRKDLIKYMNEDPEYLTKYNIRIFDYNGNELIPTDIDWSTDDAVNYLFRQEPGAENSLGHVRINFHNAHSVYLHDTPSKTLFGENQRFHSSGCVRVDEVDAFVAWILRDSGWDLAAVQATFASGERLDVPVKSPVALQTTYITAWANRQGVVSFRDDVYDYDAAGKVEFDA